MTYNIPTYQECQSICEKSQGLFYETKFIVDDYNISIFNYRLASYLDFVRLNSFELRGLTFVFNLDGTLHKSFPLMEKFFNVNENESTLIEKLSNKKINSVYLKEDGSIISFISLPNGKILAKSKNSLFSDQAISAQTIFENNQSVNSFVKNCLNNGLNPIFEYVGPKNRVVVKYNDSKLILLRLRNSDGVYLPIIGYGLDTPMSFKFTLNDLLNLKSKLESIEGWVIEFTDGQKVKLKTDWYMSLHRIMTDYSNREDYLIDMILDEKIDDILSVLDYGSESRNFVEKVLDITNHKFSNYTLEVNKLLRNYNGDRKEFAIKYSSHELFGVLMQVINGKDLTITLKEFVKKKTYRLSDARKWLIIW